MKKEFLLSYQYRFGVQSDYQEERISAYKNQDSAMRRYGLRVFRQKNDFVKVSTISK